MIIPVKCFTCGKVLADKYRYYQSKVIMEKRQLKMPTNKVVYFNDLVSSSGADIAIEKSPEAKTLDELGLVKPCCRRHFLTHVDII